MFRTKVEKVGNWICENFLFLIFCVSYISYGLNQYLGNEKQTIEQVILFLLVPIFLQIERNTRKLKKLEDDIDFLVQAEELRQHLEIRESIVDSKKKVSSTRKKVKD
jgi:hypothetical protein